ncbi:Trm112 family protein [Candidatus Xenohaliotis californiensis]
MNEEKINKLLQIIACPQTGQNLYYDQKSNQLVTEDGKINYAIKDNIPILLVDNEEETDEYTDKSVKNVEKKYNNLS